MLNLPASAGLSAPIVAMQPPTSALVLADRLLTLAQTADRAGFTASASRLVQLALAVFDEHPSGAATAWAH